MICGIVIYNYGVINLVKIFCKYYCWVKILYKMGCFFFIGKIYVLSILLIYILIINLMGKKLSLSLIYL